MGDKQERLTYASVMDGGTSHILVKLDTRDPIEVGDFVAAFTSVARQYEQYMREARPDLAAEARVYVREVRAGCIEAELVPLLVAGFAHVMSAMDKITIVDGFARFYSARIAPYFNKGGRLPDASKSDLKDFMGAVAAIANDPDGSATLSTVTYEDGERSVRAALTFDTRQARAAEIELTAHRLEIEHTTQADHSRVLMTFVQSNIKSPTPNRRTGEQVLITSIHPKALPIVYAAELAEQRIKHEIKESPENVFLKGFVVDVNVEMRNSRPVAFRVTHVHDVIDLPGEGEG